MRASVVLFSPLLLVLAMSINSTSAEDKPFGRLFTSPEQRVKLDGMREKIALDANFINQKIVETATTAPTSTTPTKKEDIQLSGYILREDGSAMIWINGRSELSGLNSRELKTTKPRANQSQVTVSAQGRARSLKPGQVWSLNNNRVQESYLSAQTPLVSTTATSPENIESSDEALEASE